MFHTLQVEAAYDILLMQSLSRRRSGDVDSKVKFADVKPTKIELPNWLRSSVSNSPVEFIKPRGQDAAIQAGVFAGLAIWTYASGLGSDDVATLYSSSASDNIPGLQIALGFAAALYYMYKDKVKLGKCRFFACGDVA